MMPADQRLEPGNPFALDIDDRLVEQPELVLRQRVAQRILDRLPLARLIVHRIGIETIDAAPRILRRIKREVGVADERRRGDPLPLRHRDAERRSNTHLLALDRERFGEAQEDRIGNARELLGLAHLRHDDLELVAAEPPDLPLVADDLRQPARDLLQQLVAHRMPQRIVHRLEPVEIHQQQCTGLRLPAMALERALEQVGDMAPVREARERVVARKLVDLALGPFLVGQVGSAAPKALEITEFVADRMTRDRPPALLARHRGLHRQLLERRARRQAEPQCALLALVIADPLADDVGKGVPKQLGERPVEPRGDGRRDIDELAMAIGFPEPATPRALEIAHQVQRTLLVADAQARGARRTALVPHILAHHDDQQAKEDEPRDRKRPRCHADGPAQRGRPREGKKGRTDHRNGGRRDKQRADMDRGKGIEMAAAVGDRERIEHRGGVKQRSKRDQHHAQHRHQPHAAVRDRTGFAHHLPDHRQRDIAGQARRHDQPVRRMIEEAGKARQKGKGQECQDAADKHIMPQLRHAHQVRDEFR